MKWRTAGMLRNGCEYGCRCGYGCKCGYGCRCGWTASLNIAWKMCICHHTRRKHPDRARKEREREWSYFERRAHIFMLIYYASIFLLYDVLCTYIDIAVQSPGNVAKIFFHRTC